MDGIPHDPTIRGRVRPAVDRGHVGEIRTGVRFPILAAGHDSGVLAVGGLSGGVLVEPETGAVSELAGAGVLRGLTFSSDGSQLVGVRSDGAVGWWDVGTGEMIGNLWTVTNDTEYSAPWFDTDKGTVWVTSGSRLLELHLEPGRWIERACDFVGRDLTSEEWDRYVPGDGPVHSACSWKVLLDLSGFSAVRELKAPIGRSPAPPRGDRSDPGKHPQPDVTPSSCELRSNDRRIERS